MGRKHKKKKNAKVKSVFGLLLCFIALYVLFWNEGRAVKTAKSLKEGRGIIVPVSAESVDPASNGSLVHMAGRVYSPLEAVHDPELMLSFTNVIRLKRETEMYQWRRSGTTRDNDTAYSYKKVWKNKQINSDKFPDEYANPLFFVNNKTISADVIKIGSFKIGYDLSQKIKTDTAIHLNETHFNQLPGVLKEKAVLHKGGLYIAYEETPFPASPQIGDMRIWYSVARPAVMSVIAEQQGNLLSDYQTKAGNFLAILKTGRYNAGQMFAEAVQQNIFMTWMLRFMGIGGMILACRLIFGVFAGRFIAWGKGPFSTVLGLGLSLATISIAWLYYRPLVSVISLAIVGVIAFAAKKYSDKQTHILHRRTFEADILKLAEQKSGRLTIVEVMAEFAVDAETAKNALESFASEGIAEIEITESGVLVYSFYDIRHLAEKESARGVLDA